LGPKGNAWKNQSLTPNTSLRYLYVFFNTKDDGPVVLDLPPAANGASFLGTIADAWQVPLTDIGSAGNGGKYLVLPPDFGTPIRTTEDSSNMRSAILEALPSVSYTHLTLPTICSV